MTWYAVESIQIIVNELNIHRSNRQRPRRNVYPCFNIRNSFLFNSSFSSIDVVIVWIASLLILSPQREERITDIEKRKKRTPMAISTLFLGFGYGLLYLYLYLFFFKKGKQARVSGAKQMQCLFLLLLFCFGPFLSKTSARN